MRSQASSRRIQNGIMKSPSPDIANRNIIKDTRPPIEDIKRYLERESHSRSPKVMDLSQSARFSNDDTKSLKRKIAELEQRSTQQLSQIKTYMQRIENLEIELEHYRNINDQNKDPSSVKGGEDDRTLELMKERVFKLLEENKRLGGLLQDKETIIQTITSDYKLIKSELEQKEFELTHNRNQSQTHSQRGTNSGPIGPLLTVAQGQTQGQEAVLIIKKYYEDRIEPEMRRFETEINRKLQDLNDKLRKVEQNQTSIEFSLKSIQKQSPIKTPSKNEKLSPLFSTANDHESGGVQIPYNTRPFSSIVGMKSARETETASLSPLDSRSAEEIIRNLENRIEKLERENQQYRDLLREREGSNRGGEGSEKGTAVSSDYNRKIIELQQELELKNLSLQSTQRELSSLEEDYNRLKEKSGREGYLWESENLGVKMAYEQEKQKYEQLNHEYTTLNERYLQIEQKLREKEREIENLKDHIRIDLEEKEQNIKHYYEDLLRSKDRAIGEQLHQYLQVLHSIRLDLQQSPVDEVLGEGEALLAWREGAERQIQCIREENTLLIQDLKHRLISQEQHIIELEKDKQMLQTEVYELEKQKDKLKKSMFEIEGWQNVGTSSQVITSSSLTQRFDSGCKLQQCLKETVRKIDALEHQITNILME